MPRSYAGNQSTSSPELYEFNLSMSAGQDAAAAFGQHTIRLLRSRHSW
jgi:hypothetical protein